MGVPGRPVVLKFGGRALLRPEAVIARVAATRAEGRPVVVVASARAGVTDALRRALAARASPRQDDLRVADLGRAHPGLPPGGRAVLRRVRRLLRSRGEASRRDPAFADRLLSQGERLAVHWLAGRLEEAGIPAAPVEADHLGLATDNAYGASRILLEASERPVRAGLGRLLAAGRVPVVTGFFGRSLEGRVATLGRGGSDYSASALGAILGAERVELVKRSVAVLTADPRLAPRARRIPRLSYEEAEELAQFGATVLHPLTIEPARGASIELRVRSLADPDLTTTIGPARSGERVRALSLLGPLVLLRLRVAGGRQRPGVVAAVAQGLRDAGVNLVALFTSSTVLSAVVEPGQARAARRALLAFAAGGAGIVENGREVGLITAIGDGVLADAARLPRAVLARAEGLSATPRSLALAVADGHGGRLLRALHRILVEGARP